MRVCVCVCACVCACCARACYGEVAASISSLANWCGALYRHIHLQMYKCTYKDHLGSVVCEIWRCCGLREERLLRKEGGGGGLFESRPWYGKWKIGGVLSIHIKGQIGGYVLHKLYHW